MKHCAQTTKRSKLFNLFFAAALLSTAVGCADVGEGQPGDPAADEGLEETSAGLISSNVSVNPTHVLNPVLNPSLPDPSDPTTLQSSGQLPLINCDDGADNCHACGGGWVPAACKRLNWYGGCAEMSEAFCNYAH